MSFATGTLVSARGREWVVQPPGEDPDLLLLKPVGGADNETVGVLTDLEPVEAAGFGWPTPDDVGSTVDATLLRDAVRLGFRSSAGPFRSFARIGVEPRPYQLVPLLMAMKLDPVRLLIADDVGIGKTVEAGLVATELFATGQVDRLAVLCPPHLAEQWAEELADKFHMDPTMVLSSTAPRLERNLPYGESLFEHHRVTVVSTDFIKTDRRRAEFLRAAPPLVIVDEAHTAAADQTVRRTSKHQRHELVKDLSADPHRHLLLVTATPHSGKEGTFRSLLGLLHQDLRALPEDDSYPQWARDLLARHFVQRKRADIRLFLDEETPFPQRETLPEQDGHYQLTGEYRALIDQVRDLSRERLTTGQLADHQQRMRYWAVLGLLRHVASSPRAAAATLRNRNPVSTTDSVDDADTLGRDVVLDRNLDDDATADDTTGGVADTDDDPDLDRLEQLARTADRLQGPKHDAKLAHTIKLVRKLLKDGFNPIVFCKYIDTAEYVAEHLAEALPNKVAVDAVTGRLPSDQREKAVRALADHDQRVLVATDCLSEGINLQAWFSAVVHYDLPWNPTGLEQREGRVDRYGQQAPTVRIATIYTPETIIDEVVMDVLLRKHRTIRSSLGISIPVPGDTDEFLSTAVDRLLNKVATQATIDLDSDPAYQANRAELFARWDAAHDDEKASRARYAQHTIRTDEVQRELDTVRGHLGTAIDLARFVTGAVRAYGGTVTIDRAEPHRLRISLTGIASDLADTLRLALDLDRMPDTVKVTTQLPAVDGELHITRTHPFVTALAGHVLDGALDPHIDSPAARAGVTRTDTVDTVTVLLLLRHRYDLTTQTAAGRRHTQLVENVTLVGYQPNADGTIEALDAAVATGLLEHLDATSNLTAAQRQQFAATLLNPDRFDGITGLLTRHVTDAATGTLAAHRRVREQAGGGLGRTDIDPHLPPDVVGAYLLIPAGGAA